MDYILVRGQSMYLAGCRVFKGKVQTRRTKFLKEAQLFKKPFAEEVLAKVSSEWTMRKYVPQQR